MPSMASIVAELTRLSLPDTELQSQQTRLPAPSTHHALPERFPSWLVDVVRARGILDLSPSQYEALDRLHQGQHVYLTAPTGSGRGLVRQLALFQSLAVDRQGYALCVFAHKQRERTQYQHLMAWNDLLGPDHQLSTAIYDGDTPVTERRAMRQQLPQVVLTTPEMLHAGILAYHSGWRTLFQTLKLVIIPDLHLCTGALSSHLCHLIRRLSRLARHYGSTPQVLLTSAPLSHPERTAQTLSGQTCQVVRGESWRPQTQYQMMISTTQNELEIGAALLAPLQSQQIPTVVLAPNPEAFCAQLQFHPAPLCPTSSEEYQTAELKLLRGEATTLVLSHDAPVHSINSSAVHSVIGIGLSKSLTHLHAWLHWLGSRSTESLGLLILNQSSPLERLIMRYPDMIHGNWWQRLPLTLHNPFLLHHHLLCAASELSIESTEQYPGIHQLERFLRWMVGQQALMQRTASREWVAADRRPHRRLNLRWFERPITLINQHDTKRLGRLDPVRAFRDCLEGGTYLHGDGRVFHVQRVDTERHRVILQPAQESLLDRGIGKTRLSKKRLAGAVIKPNYRCNFGALDYTETIEMVERINSEIQTRHSLHMLPGTAERHVRTQAAWFSFPQRSAGWNQSMRPALHMIVHAGSAVLPLFIDHEPYGIGGGLYETDDSENPGLNIVFVDRHAGGSGIAAALYQAADSIWAAALALLQQCDCAHGCQQCTAAPCDTCSGTDQPNREAGISLLQQMLGTTITTWSHLDPAPSILAPSISAPAKQMPHYLYLALTTQKASDDVGGWQHKHLLGLGLAMTYDTLDKCYRVYTEETVDQLIDNLHRVDGVIGFNTHDFEYQVLQAYTERPLPSLPTCAMLDDVQRSLGYRVSLSQLVRETLAIDRPDDSIETVSWYQNGQAERLIDVCQRDLNLIRELVRHGARTGTLNYQETSGAKGSMSVTWTFTNHHG